MSTLGVFSELSESNGILRFGGVDVDHRPKRGGCVFA